MTTTTRKYASVFEKRQVSEAWARRFGLSPEAADGLVALFHCDDEDRYQVALILTAMAEIQDEAGDDRPTATKSHGADVDALIDERVSELRARATSLDVSVVLGGGEHG